MRTRWDTSVATDCWIDWRLLDFWTRSYSGRWGLWFWCICFYGTNSVRGIKRQFFFVMGAFGKEVSNRFVRFVYEIVDHKQDGLAAVKVLKVWQAASKFNLRVVGKQLLVFAVTVYNSGRWRLHYDVYTVDQFKHELRFATFLGICHQRRERMKKRQSHAIVVDESPELRLWGHSAWQQTELRLRILNRTAAIRRIWYHRMLPFCYLSYNITVIPYDCLPYLYHTPTLSWGVVLSYVQTTTKIVCKIAYIIYLQRATISVAKTFVCMRRQHVYNVHTMRTKNNNNM